MTSHRHSIEGKKLAKKKNNPIDQLSKFNVQQVEIRPVLFNRFMQK